MKTILITGTSSGISKKFFQFREWNLIASVRTSFQDYTLEKGGVR